MGENGRTAVLFDSGVRSGLDILRALALGADFVLLGRSFIWGVAALGSAGGDHTAEILMADLKVNMVNLGCETVEQVKQTLNPELSIHGIVLTMYDSRNNLSGQVVADGSPETVLTEAALAEHYGASVRVVTVDDRLAVLPARSPVRG